MEISIEASLFINIVRLLFLLKKIQLSQNTGITLTVFPANAAFSLYKCHFFHCFAQNNPAQINILTSQLTLFHSMNSRCTCRTTLLICNSIMQNIFPSGNPSKGERSFFRVNGHFLPQNTNYVNQN